MSAPTSKDPNQVTTKDGTVWVTAAVTTSGRHLYAPEGVSTCPQFVMATVEELAEIGIVPTRQRQQEDPHDGPLHRDYRYGRDDLALPHTTDAGSAL
ncbi:hypothetical protein [Streptomyces sp. NPDC101115]|uniref:hypothetical protein n=1 Tax=Streptomyces sp. NPDC101115 TaxID=3366106 RepID=UPI00381B3CDC